MDLQREISLDNNQRKIGKRFYVLVDGVSAESRHLFQARHEGQAPEVDGVVYINEGQPKIGEFAIAKISDAHEYDLVGKIS